MRGADCSLCARVSGYGTRTCPNATSPPVAHTTTATTTAQTVLDTYKQHGVPAALIGKVSSGKGVEVKVAGAPAVTGDVAALRDVWEETSFVLERLQCAEECVAQEQAGLKTAKAAKWHLPFTPAFTPADKLKATDKVRSCPRP